MSAAISVARSCCDSGPAYGCRHTYDRCGSLGLVSSPREPGPAARADRTNRLRVAGGWAGCPGRRWRNAGPRSGGSTNNPRCGSLHTGRRRGDTCSPTRWRSPCAPKVPRYGLTGVDLGSQLAVTVAGGRSVVVEIAHDARIRQAVQPSFGWVLDPAEVAADKTLALFGRGGARHLADCCGTG